MDDDLEKFSHDELVREVKKPVPEWPEVHPLGEARVERC